jgi:hypothetical protein
MEANVNEVELNGVVYVRKGSVQTPAPKRDGMDYCIVRTYSAGVFAGYLERREGQDATVRDARRLWYWNGAASLSQLAVDGTSKPSKCKFPVAVDRIDLTNVIEVIPCTEKAQKSIEEVKIWTA